MAVVEAAGGFEQFEELVQLEDAANPSDFYAVESSRSTSVAVGTASSAFPGQPHGEVTDPRVSVADRSLAPSR